MKEIIKTITKEEAFQKEKPRYNPYQTGHGVMGDIKYNREKQKKKDKIIIRESDYE